VAATCFHSVTVPAQTADPSAPPGPGMPPVPAELRPGPDPGQTP